MMSAKRKNRRDVFLVPVQYNSLEELRVDKRRLAGSIHNSVKSVREGVKQSLLPSDDTYLNSSSRYLRLIGYGLTAWKTARTVSRFVSYFRRK